MWFEDFEIGEPRYSTARTITEGDMMNFAGLTGDYSPVHTDEEACKETEFGTRIVHGLLGLAIAQGLCWRTNYKQGTGVASLGWTDWNFKKPILPGDTVHTKWWTVEKRESKSKPGMGVMKEHVQLINQRGEVVQEGDHIELVRTRPAV
jgi:acyl dehydratase